MDLSITRAYNVLAGRKGFSFFVNIEYENIPKFVSHCNMIGHTIDAYKKINLDAKATVSKNETYKAYV